MAIKRYHFYERKYREQVDLRHYEADIKSAIRRAVKCYKVTSRIIVKVYANYYEVYGSAFTPSLAKKAGSILANSGSHLAHYCVFKGGGHKLFYKFEEEDTCSLFQRKECTK